MATTTQLWTWDSGTESFTLTGGDNSTLTRDTGNGDPTNGSLKHVTSGRNKTSVEPNVPSSATLSTTWEGMGVPASSTVTSVQVTDIRSYYGLTDSNTVDQYGPVHIHITSGGTDVTTTNPLYTRSGSASADSGWQTGSGSDLAVTSSYQASNTSLTVDIQAQSDNGNNASAASSVHVDYVELTITYSAAATTYSGSFTADAYVETVESGSFTIDAEIYAPTAYDKLVLDMDPDTYWPGDDPSGVLTERARERFNDVIAELNPTFHITMDDVAGAAAIDLTGNGHDGTYDGTPTTDTLDWTSDSGAMTVDRATGEGISIPDHADLDLGTSDYTWVLGVRIPATWYTTDWQAFFAKGSGNPYLFGTMTTSNQLGMYIVDTAYALPMTTTMNDNEYHLLMVTLDRSGNVSVYVDGGTTPEATADVSAKVSDDIQGANALNIGYGNDLTYAFSGGLQHLAGFKGTLLTGADFARLYKTRSLDGIAAVSTATYGITGPTINSEVQTAINPSGMMFQAPATSDGWGPFEQYDWQKGMGISMWVKASTDALTSGYLAGMVNDSAVHDRSFEMYYSSGRPQFYARSWPGDAPAWSDFALVGDAVDDDVWHHVVMEIAPDTGKPRGWIDGTLVDFAGQSYRFNRWIGDTQMCLQIASGATATGSQLNGIAKVAVRNRPFSASERDTLRLGTVSTAQNQSISLTGNIGPSADISAYDYFNGSRDAVDIHSTTADDGSTWGGSTGTDDFIVNSNRGRATVQYMQSGDYTDPTLRLGHTALGDKYVRALYGWDVDPVETRENNTTFAVSARNNASGYGYHLETLHASDGGISIRFRARDSGGWVTPWQETQDAAAWTDHTTEKFWVELKITGTNPNVALEGRVWKDGDSYPTTADITSTGNNLTDIPSTGTSGFWAAVNDASQDNGAYVEAFEVEEPGPPWTGPVLESSTELAVNNDAAPSVTLPSGTTTGDLLYMVIASANSVSIDSIGDGTRTDYALRVDATPAHGDLDHHIYWKIAESGETAPTINFAAAETTTVWLGRISGVDQTTTFDSATGLSATTAAVESSHTTASKTPSVNNTLILATDAADIGTGDTAPNWTVDSGFTEDSDFHEAVQGQATTVAWKQVATAAATSATFTLVQDDWHSTTIEVIRPAPSGGTGSFTADAHIWNTDADYSDSFNRTVASGIGTSSGGDVWGGSGLTSYDVTPSYVHSTLNNGITSTSAVTLDHANVLNQRLRVLFGADRSPATSSLSIALALRHDGLQSGQSYYRANFRFESSDSKVDMFVDSNNAGSWTNLTGGSSWVEVGTWADLSTEQWWVEVQVTNSNPTFIETRVWKDGTARPSSPSSTGWDSASNQDGAAGVTGFFWANWDTTDTELRIHQWEVWDLGQHAFTIDGYVKTVESGSFTADAYISDTIAGSFTADAVIQKTQTGSFTVDAWIESAYTTLVKSMNPDGYWPLDDSSGDARDASGNGFTGTAYGTPTYRQTGPTINSVSQSAIDFQSGDAEDEFAISETIDDSVTTSTGMAVSLWFKTSTAGQGLIGQYGGGASSWYIWLSASGVIEFNTVQTDGSTIHGQATTGTGLNDGAWHHVVARVDSSANLHVSVDNGTEASDTSPTGTWNAETSRYLAIGLISSYYNGSLAHAAYWSRPVTGGERASLYSGQAYTTESGSFTADAAISATMESSFTADADIQRTYSGSFTADATISAAAIEGSFTADAYIQTVETGSFTADANLSATVEGSFTADAELQRTFSGSFTADAEIERTFSGSFTVDAEIQNTYSGSFTADAYVYDTFSGSFTADADLQRTFSGTFTADAYVYDTFGGSFTADSHLSATVSGSFTADAEIQVAGTVTGNFTADAYIQTVESGSFTADADIQRTYSGSFTADAEVQNTYSGSFTADAEVQQTYSGSFTAEGYVYDTFTGAFTADAAVQRTYGGTFTADSHLSATVGGSFTADAWIQVAGTITDTFTADAYIQRTYSGSFTADAYIYETYGSSFTADAEVQRTFTGSFTADSEVQRTFESSFTADGHLSNTIGGSFTVDAWILTAGTIVDSFTADAYIQTVETGSFTADAYVQRTYGGTFTTDAELQQTFSGSFSADAEVKATIAQTFTADAQIWNTMGDTFTVDAMVQQTYGGTFTVDAEILGGNFGQFTADAYIRQTFAQTFTVDAEVQQTYSGSFTADSEVQRTEGGTFTYDSHLSAVVGGSFTLDAFLLNPDFVTPGVTFIVTVETDDHICDIQYSDPTATIDYA